LQKLGRKIYHLTGGLVLIALYVRLGRVPGLAMLIGVFLGATAVDMARLRLPAFNEFIYKRFSMFIRDSERGSLTGTPWYVLGILCSAAFYGAPVAVYAVAFLACGDVAATTVGERWGTIKVSGSKSLQGTLAFLAASSVAGLMIDRLFFPISPIVFVVGAASAAVVEVLPLKLNDNLTIPVIAGGVMKLMLGMGI
jgi:glycerol-3-phosphate acyltransferase PlsY